MVMEHLLNYRVDNLEIWHFFIAIYMLLDKAQLERRGQQKYVIPMNGFNESTKKKTKTLRSATIAIFHVS